jgi:hypothetical protein
VVSSSEVQVSSGGSGLAMKNLSLLAAANDDKIMNTRPCVYVCSVVVVIYTVFKSVRLL